MPLIDRTLRRRIGTKLAQLVAEQVDASLTMYLASLVPDDRYKEISLDEAASYVGISTRRLRMLAAEGKLEARRRGKRWVTWPGALDTYLLTRNPVGKPRQVPQAEGQRAGPEQDSEPAGEEPGNAY